MAKDRTAPGVEALAEALWQADAAGNPKMLKAGLRWDVQPAYLVDKYRTQAEGMAIVIESIRPGYSIVPTIEHRALEGVAAAAERAWDESDAGSIPHYVGNALQALDEARRRAGG